MINISSLANFLSINAKEIENINSVTNDEGNFISITLKRKVCYCPNCSSIHYEIKDYVKRKIKHALFLNKETTFLLKSRRYKCLQCKKTFIEENPFAPKKSRVSFETIKAVLVSSREYNNTWKEIGRIAHISDTSAINIFDRYVNIKRYKLPRVLSIDECYNKHQFEKPYSCILFDFLETKIIDVIQDRSKYSLITYFGKLTKEERDNVEYVVIDMWEPYLHIAEELFHNATIAIDSFHVIKEIGFALDKTRRRILRGYSKGSEEYYLLKKWYGLLYKSQEPWGEKMKIKGLGNKWYNKYQLQEKLLSINIELRIAYSFYNDYKFKNEHTHIDGAEVMINSFINNVVILKVQEFHSIIKMLINWKEYIINSFNIVESRRLSNGPIEGFNSNFKKIMTVSNGLYSFERFRNRLMYCYNKINCIMPVKETIKKKLRGKRGVYKKPGNH